MKSGQCCLLYVKVSKTYSIISAYSWVQGRHLLVALEYRDGNLFIH